MLHFRVQKLGPQELGVDQLAQDVTDNMAESQYDIKHSDSKPLALPNTDWKKRSQGLIIHLQETGK